jgi:hypothetical protein
MGLPEECKMKVNAKARKIFWALLLRFSDLVKFGESRISLIVALTFALSNATVSYGIGRYANCDGLLRNS